MSVAPRRREASAGGQVLASHAELVRRIAHHLAARLPPGVDVEDLVQAGMIGLTEARRHFEGRRGASFETFASFRIRGAMIDELRRGSWAPRSLHRRARAAAEAIRAIEQATGREAAPAEVARALGLSLAEYGRLCSDAARAPVLSLHGPAEQPAARVAAADHDQPLPQLEHAALRAALMEAIGTLPEREQRVLALYYGEQLNLREIGAVLDLTESRICQIHGQALLRLRGRLADWREFDAP